MGGQPVSQPSLIDTLCTRCGLCCDGSLFAEVELARGDESTSLEVMGLEIEDDDEGSRALLAQPCGALKGRRCSIYPHRPSCCRTFECRLLQQAQRGVLSVERAMEKLVAAVKHIERVNALVVRLGRYQKKGLSRGGATGNNERLPFKERYLEALARTDQKGARAARKGIPAELKAAVTSAERLLGPTFLGL